MGTPWKILYAPGKRRKSGAKTPLNFLPCPVFESGKTLKKVAGFIGKNCPPTSGTTFGSFK